MTLSHGNSTTELWRNIDVLHRLLVESVSDYAIYALTRTGQVATWNPGATRLTGYEADEIIGRSFEVFYDEAMQAIVRNDLDRAIEEGSVEREVWKVRKDGTRFWAGTLITPLRDADGNVVGFAKVTRDLTVHREAAERERELLRAEAAKEAALASGAEARSLVEQLRQATEELELRHEEAQVLAEELEVANEELHNAAVAAEEARDTAERARRTAEELRERYHRIFESTPLPMWTVHRNSLQFVDVNEAAVLRYGYSREEFLQMSAIKIRAPEEANKLEWQLDNLLRDGSFFVLTRHCTKSGEVVDVEVRAREIVHDGQPALVAVVTDVSTRMRAEARQRFLTRATDALAGARDYLHTIGQVVRLAVPDFADWAAYNVRDGEFIRTVAIHHANPDLQRLAHEFGERYPLRAARLEGTAKVLATGKPEYVSHIPDELLRVVAHDDEHYRILRSIGFASLISTPVIVNGEVVGALDFATGESRRHFNEDDLEFAEELARRAALAIENVRHFEAEHAARARAERGIDRLHRLQRIASALSEQLDVSETSTGIVDLTMQAIGADAAYLVRRTADPKTLELVHGTGYMYQLEQSRTSFPAKSKVPGADVMRTLEPIWLENRAEREQQYPDLRDSPVTKEFGSSATLPLVVNGRGIGALGMHFREEREFSADDRAFLGALAEQTALALERATYYEAEQRARQIAERLQSVTALLSEAVTPAQVTDVVVGEGLRALGAGAGFVAVLDDDGQMVEIHQSVGYLDTVLAPYQSIPIDAHVPVASAIRDGEAVWLPSPESVREQFPSIHPGTMTSEFCAWAALPLFMQGRTRGVIGLSFSSPLPVNAEERTFMLSLARQCAQALERARLYEAEQRARANAARGRARAEFLADASRLLSATLDYNETLESVARATVPVLGDWCAVDMLEDTSSNAWPPTVRRVAVMHTDPAKVEWARKLADRFPTDWEASSGLPRVLRDGVTEFIPVMTPEFVRSSIDSNEQRQVLDEVGLTAYMCIPLRVRGRTVGGLTLCMSESQRHYTHEDLALAEELARRASLAIENAELYREAQLANAAKAQFLAVMSHELRTPLNAIGGYAELLELGVRGTLTEEQLHDIQRIRRSQHHLLALINDVLNFARVEAGHVQFAFDDVRIGDYLDEVVSLLQPQAAAKDIELLITDCDEHAHAWADSEKVQQILLNLLSNSVKFTPSGGRVSLNCQLYRDTVEVQVADTGIGIPPDRLSAIFDPFVQVQSGLTRASEGTGLGLAISRDLARGMHGDLRVESTLGQGSVFTLSLPRTPESPT